MTFISVVTYILKQTMKAPFFFFLKTVTSSNENYLFCGSQIYQ